MKLRLMSAIALAFVLVSTLVLAPAPAVKAQTPNPTQNVPVTGSFAGGTFSGLLNITRFAVQNGQLVALGTLSGTLTNTIGGVVGTITNAPVTLPVSSISGSCPILHLDLGPLNLTLLGLNVSLNQVVLDITAQSGAGNLLGNLLCAVAHLLDNPTAPLGGIANLLNQILAAL